MEIKAHILLSNIAEALKSKAETDIGNQKLQPLGALDGAFGTLMFLSRYRKYADDSRLFSRVHDDYLNLCLSYLVNGFSYPTYCSGLSGILYILRKEYSDSIDISDAEPIYDQVLKRYLDFYLSEDNWDLLHGALGIGYYYLLRDDKPEIHDTIVAYLENNTQWDGEGGCRIKCVIDYQTGEKGYNIGLSHGMSGIIVYLSALLRKYRQDKVRTLLDGFVNYVLQQRIDFAQYGSHFPTRTKSDLSGSRLAWCYGDLGICGALYQAAGATKDASLRLCVTEILNDDVQRYDLSKNLVYDSCICHGASGIALIFNEFNKVMPGALYQDAVNYWVDRTVDMASFEDGIAGIKVYNAIDKVFRNEYDLLEGVTGVGLSLMSILYGESWADLMLINLQ